MKVQEKKGATLPGAWIVSTNDKGRKSIKSGNIYLDDNENFEIELYNPLKVNVLADIRLNGQSISKTGLIVKPGQRFYLDCFVDDKKKFIFQTYHVDGTSETQEAIADNGLMEVFFYKEDVVTIQNWADKYRKTVVREYYPIYVDRYPYPYYPAWIYCGGTTTLSHATGGLCLDGNIGGNFPVNTIKTNISGGGGIFAANSFSSNTNISTSATSYTSNSSSGVFNASSGEINLINDGKFNESTLETGRIEKGTASNQKFVEIDMDFEKNYIHHIIYQLLPVSKKPVEVETKKKDSTSNVIDLLKGLGDLKTAGILTEKEFEEKKKELLDRI